jgi:hypothetical protein
VFGARGPTLPKTCVARLDLCEEVQSTPGAALVATAFPPPIKKKVWASWGTRISRQWRVLGASGRCLPTEAEPKETVRGPTFARARCWCPAAGACIPGGGKSEHEEEKKAVDWSWVDTMSPAADDTRGNLYHARKWGRSTAALSVTRFSLGEEAPVEVARLTLPELKHPEHSEVIGAAADGRCVYVCVREFLTEAMVVGEVDLHTKKWAWSLLLQSSSDRRQRQLPVLVMLPPSITGFDRPVPSLVTMGIAHVFPFGAKRVPGHPWRYVWEEGGDGPRWLPVNRASGPDAEVGICPLADGRLVLHALVDATADSRKRLRVWLFVTSVSGSEAPGPWVDPVGERDVGVAAVLHGPDVRTRGTHAALMLFIENVREQTRCTHSVQGTRQSMPVVT